MDAVHWQYGAWKQFVRYAEYCKPKNSLNMLSFTRDSTIRVAIDGISSHEFKINSGVPLLRSTSYPVSYFSNWSSLSYLQPYPPLVQSCLAQIEIGRRDMHESLSVFLLIISECGHANQVDLKGFSVVY